MHVEGGIVAIELADLHEVRVLPGDVGQLADGDQRDVKLGRGLALVVHPAVEVEVGFEAVEEPGSQSARSSCDLPRLGVPAALVFGLLDERDVAGCVSIDVDPALDESS